MAAPADEAVKVQIWVQVVGLRLAAVYSAAAPTKAEFDALVDVATALRARLAAHG